MNKKNTISLRLIITKYPSKLKVYLYETITFKKQRRIDLVQERYRRLNKCSEDQHYITFIKFVTTYSYFG